MTTPDQLRAEIITTYTKNVGFEKVQPDNSPLFQIKNKNSKVLKIKNPSSTYHFNSISLRSYNKTKYLETK